MKFGSSKFKIEIVNKTGRQKLKKQHQNPQNNYLTSDPSLSRVVSAMDKKKFSDIEEKKIHRQKSAEITKRSSIVTERYVQKRNFQSTISNQFIRKLIQEPLHQSQKLTKNKEQGELEKAKSVQRIVHSSTKGSKLRKPSQDVYAITCLSINLMEMPMMKNRNSLFASKHLITKKSVKSERRNIQLSKLKQRKYIHFTSSDSDRKDTKKLKYFIQFLFKVNYSNRIYVPMEMRDTGITKKWKICVEHGNNHTLIKSILSQRFWIEISPKVEEDTVFIWSPQKIRRVHQRQRHLILRKIDNLVKPKKQIRFSEEVYQQNCKILWAEDSIRAQNYIQEEKIKIPNWGTYQVSLITNHLPKNSCIGAKKNLTKVLFHYYQFHEKKDPFQVIPRTYIVRSAEDPEFKRFLRDNEGSLKVWIVKPGENSNQGKGIQLAKTKDIGNILKKQKQGGKHDSYIIQSYIQKPLLYYDRKFDFRHYFLLTSVNGILKAYWYKDGYCRTSSQFFSLEDLNNQFVHLTNDSVQRESPNYGKYEVGNKISYTEVQRYLDLICSDKSLNLERDILCKVKEIVRDVIKANYSLIDPKRNESNFQIFGLDFMLDKNFQPYLIQINTNPSLQINCPLLSRIIPTMIENVFRICLDPLLPPSGFIPQNKRMTLHDHYLQNLRFELIFDENHQKESYPLVEIEDSDFQIQERDEEL